MSSQSQPESVQAKAGFQTAAGFVPDIHQVVEDGKKAIAKSKITEHTPTPIQCDLAVSSGDLTKQTFDKMDDDVKIMLAGAVRGLAKLEELSYDDVMSSLMTNSLLDPMEGAAVTRSDKIIKTDKDWFKWDGSPMNSIQVQDVKSWFVRLVQDREIMEDIQLGMDFFGKVVAYAGKTVNLFEASLSTKEYHESDMVDVAVLRYPDHEHQFLTLYRINVKAFRDGSREVFTQEDTNGLTGEFHCMKFKPRASVIKTISDDTKKKAIAQANALVLNPTSSSEPDPDERVKTGFQTVAGFVHDIHQVVEEGKKALAAGQITDTSPCPFQCDLAVSAGDLNKTIYSKMDTSLKVMLAASVRGLSKLENLSYEEALSSLMQNPLLDPMEGAMITRSDKIIKTDKDWLKWDGSPLRSIGVQDVKSWFVKLIKDGEILEDLELGMDFFGKVVTYAGKTVNLFEATLTTKEYHELDVVDVSVLHFPDIKHPYLMLYRIVITAWRDGSRQLFLQEDTNGLTGEFHCVQFKPRETVIEDLHDSTIQKAVVQGAALVDN